MEAQQKRELETAKAEAEAAREKLQGLSSRDGWHGLDSGLRREVEDRRYAYLPSSAEELRTHKTDTEALVAKVEVELAEKKRLREAEAKAKAEAERVDREELAVIFDVIGDNLDEARSIRAAAEELADVFGHQVAFSAINGELNAPYGRARRQDGLTTRLPGIEEMEHASWLLQFRRAGDLDEWLAAIAAWLDATNQAVEPEIPAASSDGGNTVDLSKLDVSKLFGGNVHVERKRK